MYTIKQAAVKSGVAVQLLRAWERRYGVVEPDRTEAGYRLYDDDAIDRLRAMRRLIADGWAPSNAARHLRALDQAAVAQLLADHPGPDVDAGGAAAFGPPPIDPSAKDLSAAFVSSATALDEAGYEDALDDMFARGSFEHVASELVMPALVALGAGWADGRLDVAAEHAAAGAVQRRLAMAFMAAGRPSEAGRPVLVGLPPGGRHELGALAFATAARRAGIAVRYLGADLPLQDWLDAVSRAGAPAVVIGAVAEGERDAAERVARAIRAVNPDIVIAFGGRAGSELDTAQLQPALNLPDDFSAAVDALKGALRGRQRSVGRRR